MVLCGSLIGAVQSIAGCALARTEGPLVGDPARVQPYSPELQARLFVRPVPFLASFARRPYTMGFVAAEHSVDANGATFKTITAAFDRIRPAVVILEGFPTDWGNTPQQIATLVPRRNNPDADSYSRGEAVHAASIALARGVPFIGGEPTHRQLTTGLLAAGFKQEDIHFCDMIKVLNQDLSAGQFSGVNDPQFATSYSNWAASLSRGSGFEDPGIARFRLWYRETFLVELDADPHWANRTNPGGNGLGAEISRTQGVLRDRHLFGLAVRLLNERQSVLIVYGASHLANLWAAFESMLGPPQLDVLA